MSVPRFSEEDVEPLVRSVLKDEALRVDVDKNYTAIQRRIDVAAAAVHRESSNPVRRWERWRPIAVRTISVAAGFILAVGVGCWTLYPPETSAYTILLAAQAEATNGADRCYRAEAGAPKTWGGQNALLDVGWQAVVWTRGDRFRATITGPRRNLDWGKDENGNVWLVARPDCGLIFAQRKVPPLLAAGRSFLGLDFARLTKRFVSEFELRREKPLPSDGAQVAVICATAKPDSPKMHFNSARLVIELGSNLIRRMELYRTVDGIERANLTLTLIDLGRQPDTSYRLLPNLQAGAQVLNDDRAKERDAAFRGIVRDFRRRKVQAN